MAGEHFVIDTNVFIENPNCLKDFEGKITIPNIVFEEITSLKSRSGETGYNARETGRQLEKILSMGDITEGVEYKDGATLYSKESKIKHEVHDKRIIEVAKTIEDVTIISNDIDLVLLGAIEGIKVKRYSEKRKQHIKFLPDGVNNITVPGEFISTVYDNDYISIGLLSDEVKETLYPNQVVVMTNVSNPKQKAITRVHGSILEKLNLKQYPWGVKARNLEQKIAIAQLMDTEISLVTLTGYAGSSKTFLALASALELVIEKGKYKKVLIAKPPISLSKDYEVGFLPGDLNSKYMSVLGSITSNLENMQSDDVDSFSNTSGQSKLNELIEHTEAIEIISLEDIMGSSFNDSIILLDEGQLLDKEAMKAVVTRIGENSKLIITGDLKQKAKNKLAAHNSGLFHLVNNLKPSKHTAHLTMQEVYRSKLVENIIKLW